MYHSVFDPFPKGDRPDLRGTMKKTTGAITTIWINSRMRKKLEAKARAHQRSLSDQIKHYIILGLVAEENQDLPLSMIKDILEAREELRRGIKTL
jgi:hypothetical protein